MIVQGVVLDMNGREQRATRTIELSSHKNTLQLKLARPFFTVDEKIEVAAKLVDDAGKPLEASTTLVAMKLSPNPAAQASWDYPYQWNMNASNNPYWFRGAQSRHCARRRWQTIQPAEAVKRTMATAVAFGTTRCSSASMSRALQADCRRAAARRDHDPERDWLHRPRSRGHAGPAPDAR